MGRRANGDGTIYKRKDSRWAAEFTVTLANGVRERKYIIGKTGGSRDDIKAKLDKIVAQERQRIPFADKSWTVAAWINHWMEAVVSSRLKPQTISSYESIVRNYIKPLLGMKKLDSLSVRDAQNAIDQMQAQNIGIRTIHKFRQVLSASLSEAMREEIIFRNIARLVRLPSYRKKEIIPWTDKESTRFLEISRTHPLHLGFLLLLVYGMRKGEVLGLSVNDLDFENDRFRIRQQLQRLNGGLKAVSLKTEESYRILPMVPTVRKTMLGA